MRVEAGTLGAGESAMAIDTATAPHEAFLAEVSKRLGISLDYIETLEAVARAALSYFADCCLVDLVDHGGLIQRVAVAHTDAEQQALVRELALRYAPEPTALDGVPRAMRTGRAELVSGLEDGLLREIGAASAIIAPLMLGGDVLGALTFVSGRCYCETDLALAEEVAIRCARAIDHAGRYRQALEAIDARDHFVAAISHDLKNPIATVAAQAQLLRRLAASQQAAEQTERLITGITRIENTVRRMSRMIDGLLDVTRLELHEPLKLERAPMDLVEVVNRIVADHQERAPRHLIQVAGDTSVMGEWDLARLERVVDNLVGNAVKYSPDGGVINVLCACEVEETEELAILSVRDHGVGIPAADLDRIFERFQRAANVGSIGGTGLGLATIREIIKLHGGTITVESTEGQGSTFTIRVPRQDRHQASIDRN